MRQTVDARQADSFLWNCSSLLNVTTASLSMEFTVGALPNALKGTVVGPSQPPAAQSSGQPRWLSRVSNPTIWQSSSGCSTATTTLDPKRLLPAALTSECFNYCRAWQLLPSHRSTAPRARGPISTHPTVGQSLSSLRDPSNLLAHTSAAALG